VHIVYGPNEAGKSTALAAIGDLLYGFPNVSHYNFSNERVPLRLGAEIISRDGQRLAFHRVKSRGLAKTLKTPDDEQLPDNALLPFIGQVDRRMFVNAFGLSTEALRLGSRAMLDQEGEIGAALLGAASGVGDLQALQKRLEDEADEIFRPRKSAKLKFWIAQQQYRDANEDRKKSELTAPKWKQLNAEIDALDARLELLRDRLTQTSTQAHRLTRLTSVRPIINRIANHLASIKALGGLTLPTPTFTQDLGDALAASEKAARDAENAADACLKAEQDLADISLDEPLIAAGPQIDELAQGIRSYRDASAEVGEAEDAGRRAEDILLDLIADLGLANPTGLEPVELLQRSRPSLPAQERVRELIGEREEIDAEARSQQRALLEEEEELARLMRERDAVPSLVDPAAFRTSLDVFEADLLVIAEEDELAFMVAEESRKLIEEAGRLSPECDLERLATAPRPSLETVHRYRGAFDRQDAERDTAEAKLAEARQTQDAIRQSLAQLEVEGDVVTPEALNEARGSRDFNWSALRQALLAEERPNPGDLAGGIARFETAVARADALADAAIRDAQRTEAYRQQTLNLRNTEDKIKLQSDTIMLSEETRATLTDIWTDEWRDMGLVPAPPAEMVDWLMKVETLLERRDKIEQQRIRLALIEARAEGLREPLAALGQQMGLDAIDGLAARSIAARIRARLDDLTRSWDAARGVTILLQDRRERLNALEAHRGLLEARIAAWEERWIEASAALGLRIGVTIVEAKAALGLLEKLPRAIEEHTRARRKLDDLRSTISGFAEPALGLTGQLAPDLDALGPDEAIARLAERLRDARAAFVKREGILSRLTDASISRTVATSVIEATEARLAELRVLSGLGPDDDLRDFHARLSRLAQISLDLQQARSELAEQAHGESEDELRAALIHFDPDAVAAERADLAREQKFIEDERLELYAQWHTMIRQRDQLQTGSGAELALQRRMLAEGDMANLTRDWLVLKLAATLVAKATARHRAGHHVPLIERAGSLFAALTDGSFAGLVTEEDSKGRERLVGRRPDDTTVAIGRTGSGGIDDETPGGMSEGTLDQLYLAMRLAHLEDFARTSEPAPFIGDDLFMTFDDTRTSLGLKALADCSHLIQPIIFTHHARVVDIARFTLGAAADIIELQGS
jgi:uncharacterized protein YhaN